MHQLGETPGSKLDLEISIDGHNHRDGNSPLSSSHTIPTVRVGSARIS